MSSRSTIGTLQRILVLWALCYAFFLHTLPLQGQDRRAPERIAPGSSCTAQQCHGKLRLGPVVHGPLTEGDEACQLCHEADGDRHSFSLAASGSELCYSCHESVTEKKLIHAPLKDDESSCTNCHNPHSGANEKLLNTKTINELCQGCHEDFKPTVAQMSARHKLLLKENNCARCHDPHASSQEYLLRNNTQTLCLACHGAEVQSANKDGITVLKQVLTEAKHLHGLGDVLDCGLCHDPHANKQFRFLRGSYPPKFYSPYSSKAYGLCFRCHDDSLAGSARTTQATGFRNDQRNLHYVHVNKKRKGRTCRTCHDWHASENQHLLRDSVPFGQWQIPISFTPTENGGSCTPGCHRIKTYSRSAETSADAISATQAPLEDSPGSSKAQSVK